MAKEKTKYYLIQGRLLGKKESGGYYLYKEGKWHPDKENAIMDRLWGYDPSEPPGSPYVIGNTSIMDEIEEIQFDRAREYLGEDN